jgi:flagellar protein FliO/FliZ
MILVLISTAMRRFPIVKSAALSAFALLIALPVLAADDTTAASSGDVGAKALNTVNSPHLAAIPVAPSSSTSSLTMLFGLALVLGLIICVAWLLKRSGLTPVMNASAAARVVGGVSVGNRERVVVIEVADQWIVVGVSPGRVNALATMPKQESPPVSPNAAPVAKNFSSWMKQTIEKRNAPR